MKWLKAREELLRDPKLLAIGRRLRADPEFEAWAGELSAAALRHVVFSLLVATWAAARDHGEFWGDDLVLRPMEPDDLDAFAGAPGLGVAMVAVGWARAEGDAIVLPRYARHNSPMTPAERQARARRRNADVTPESRGCHEDVTPESRENGEGSVTATLPERDIRVTATLPERDKTVTDVDVDVDEEKNPPKPPRRGAGGGSRRRPAEPEEPPETATAWQEFLKVAGEVEEVDNPTALVAALRARGCEHPDSSGYPWWLERAARHEAARRTELLREIRAHVGVRTPRGWLVEEFGIVHERGGIQHFSEIKTARLKELRDRLEGAAESTDGDGALLERDAGVTSA